jgi:hypothetical protein
MIRRSDELRVRGTRRLLRMGICTHYRFRGRTIRCTLKTGLLADGANTLVNVPQGVHDMLSLKQQFTERFRASPRDKHRPLRVEGSSGPKEQPTIAKQIKKLHKSVIITPKVSIIVTIDLI